MRIRPKNQEGDLLILLCYLCIGLYYLWRIVTEWLNGKLFISHGSHFITMIMMMVNGDHDEDEDVLILTWLLPYTVIMTNVSRKSNRNNNNQTRFTSKYTHFSLAMMFECLMKVLMVNVGRGFLLSFSNGKKQFLFPSLRAVLLRVLAKL